jgi:replication factor A1
VCTTHGEVEGVPDMRVKGVLDDGTGTMNIVLNRTLTEQVLGMDMDQAIKMSMEKRSFTAVQKEVENRLLVKTVTIRGDIVLDDYGLSCYAKEISFPSIDVEKEAQRLLEEVEA